MTQINLLPWREQARNAKKVRFALSILAYVSMAIVIVILMHLYYGALISHQENRNGFLQAEHDREQVVLMQLNKKKKAQNAILLDLQFLYTLRNTTYRAVRVLDVLAHVAPEDVSFTKISRDRDTITLIGSAKSNLEVTLLMKNMAQSPFFKQPDLTEIDAKQTDMGEERSFQIKVVQQG